MRGFLSNSSSRISKHWGKYACNLCFNAFSRVKGYPTDCSLDNDAEVPSFNSFLQVAARCFMNHLYHEDTLTNLFLQGDAL